MPTGICKGCGKTTNSATSNWWMTKNFEPTKCYVAFEDDVPVKGCGYNDLPDEWYKKWIDEIINGGKK